METAAVLGQLAGHVHRWYSLDLVNCAKEDNYFRFIQGGKSYSPKMIEVTRPPPTKKSRKDKPREKFHAASSSTEIMMDQEIWKEFPEDLYEAMIARLPIATFFRFRSVCQKWNSLLNSATLSQHFAVVLPAQTPWFYTITHENANNGAMYDPSLKKWYHPCVPSLPVKTIILPVASAGGLVCFLDISHRNFCVCNPLTTSFKELALRSGRVWSRVAVGMVQNSPNGSSGYKIVWLGSNGEHEVYDSIQNSWTCPGVLPPSIKLPLSLNLRSHTVSIGSTIYFLCTNPESILSYDVANNVWKRLIVPMPLDTRDRTLAESGGKLILVGLLSKNAATCVSVWELQRMTLLWKEVDRMPNVWCLDFYGKHVWMTCISNQGLLMLSLRSKRMNRLVSYDVGKREWGKVPDCVLPRSGRKKQWIACGTAFHPCPTAMP